MDKNKINYGIYDSYNHKLGEIAVNKNCTAIDIEDAINAKKIIGEALNTDDYQMIDVGQDTVYIDKVVCESFL